MGLSYAHQVQADERSQDLGSETGNVHLATVLLAGDQRGHAHTPGLHNNCNVHLVAFEAVEVVLNNVRMPQLLQLQEPCSHHAVLQLSTWAFEALHREQHDRRVRPLEHGTVREVRGDTHAGWQEFAHAAALSPQAVSNAC